MNKALLDLNYFDVYQGILTPVILLVGLIFCLFYTPKNIRDLVIASTLYSWHTIISIYRWRGSTSGPSVDSTFYFRRSFIENLTLYPGTRFTEYLTFIIRDFLDANYLNVTLVFNIIGSLGIIYFYLSLKPHLLKLPNYFIILLFLPSISYWSGSIGKDGIATLATCLFLYSLVKNKPRNSITLISIFFMFMVRPHVALAMMIAITIYFIIRSNVHLILKVISLPILLGATTMALIFTSEFAGLEETSLDGIGDYYESREGVNAQGGGAIDTRSMSLPMKIFSFIFRPLPFEANSIISFLSGLESLFLLLLFIYIILKSNLQLKLFVKDRNLLLLIYITVASIMLSFALSNLGIAARQKWQFLPCLIYLFIYQYANYSKNKASNS